MDSKGTINEITEQFLETKHNPSVLRIISNLEVNINVNDDAELDKIVATDENLNNSNAKAKKPQGQGNKMKSGQWAEPVSSKGGCGCIVS
jgi:hypothetical protein